MQKWKKKILFSRKWIDPKIDRWRSSIRIVRNRMLTVRIDYAVAYGMIEDRRHRDNRCWVRP